jgi:hypothetical protein
MSIADELAAALIDPLDARQVAGAIAVMHTSRHTRLALIQEWEISTGTTFPLTLRNQILGLTPIGTWPRNPEAHHGHPR